MQFPGIRPLTTAVDTRDLVALFTDHESPAIVFFLKAVRASHQQATDFMLFNRVEELAANTAILPLVAGLLIGLA